VELHNSNFNDNIEISDVFGLRLDYKDERP